MQPLLPAVLTLATREGVSSLVQKQAIEVLFYLYVFT